MRLSKKIAAVALAAVMSVSLLTACGGTDAPSSSNPGSSSSSSSSSADSSSSSSSSSADSSSSSGSTEDKKETVAYKDSRTAKFYQKFGTNYTLGSKLDITANNKSETVDMLVVTNGSRTYQQATAQSKGSTESQIVLTDLTKQKKWNLASVEDDITKEQGKLGYYYSAPISGTSTGGGIPGNVMPIEGLKFKQETKGDYYIESQSYAASSNGEKVEIFIAYYFKGNDSAPEYVDVKESLGSKGTATIRVTFTRIEYKADAKYLDFETILKQYIDVTDKMPSTVQALEPSIAGLTIG